MLNKQSVYINQIMTTKTFYFMVLLCDAEKDSCAWDDRMKTTINKSIYEGNLLVNTANDVCQDVKERKLKEDKLKVWGLIAGWFDCHLLAFVIDPHIPNDQIFVARFLLFLIPLTYQVWFCLSKTQ